MSLIKPAALFVCVALAGCAGKSDPVDPVAKEQSLVQTQKQAVEQKDKPRPSTVPANNAKPDERAAGASKDAKPAAAAAKPEAKVAAKPAAKDESSWWSFGSKKKEVAQVAPAAKKVEARKVTPAWLDDHEKRLKEAVAGSKFQVERRGDVLVVVAPVDASFNPDRPSMLLPVTLGPLSRIAKLVANDPQNAVLILGHGDNSGKAEDSRKLSLERAQSIASIFRLSGLKNDRLMLRGVGADKPLVSNDNAKGRAQNRRIEVLLTLRDSLPTLVAQNSR